MNACDFVSAITALLAAGFWFMSAAVRIPPTPVALDLDAKSDALSKALRHSARLNAWAAGFSALPLCAWQQSCSCVADTLSNTIKSVGRSRSASRFIARIAARAARSLRPVARLAAAPHANRMTRALS